MTTKVYVEGGGDSARLQAECRRGFRKLIEKAGLTGRMPRVIACGGRGNAYERFCTAMHKPDPNVFPILLVDSEDAVAAAPWQHLKDRDKWDRPENAEDDQVHLMVQCMEAWFLADRRQLADYFGQGFRENALPGNANIEEIPKRKVFDTLASATRDTKTKGRYDKGSHSFRLLALIDPAKVGGASPHAQRLFDTLRQKAS